VAHTSFIEGTSIEGTNDASSEPLFAVVGPTASGKSDLGLSLAKEFNGEIVNCDSVQTYRGIYVATAKVPPSEQRGIPHHLIDIVEPTVNFTAVEWARLASDLIVDIESRGRRAFLVGGTGFYLRALATRFCDTAEVNPLLRPRLHEIASKRGPEHLHRLLSRVDPALARRYAARDLPRVTRALEVYFSSGIPLSKWQERSPVSETREGKRLHYLVLEPPRDELYRRIDERAEMMVSLGLVDEVESLIASGIPHDAKAFGAHGYRRVVEYLRGMRSLESAIEQMKLDTRHYAKRQWTWWRAQANTHWLTGFGNDREIQAQAISLVSNIKTDMLRN